MLPDILKTIPVHFIMYRGKNIRTKVPAHISLLEALQSFHSALDSKTRHVKEHFSTFQKSSDMQTYHYSILILMQYFQGREREKLNFLIDEILKFKHNTDILYSPIFGSFRNAATFHLEELLCLKKLIQDHKQFCNHY